MIESSSKVGPWREAVEGSARRAVRAAVGLSGVRWEPYPGPVLAVFTYTLRRPQSLPRRVVHHVKYPDKDKLDRSTGDGITAAQIYRDDAQIVTTISTKLYVGAPGALPQPGAFLSLWAVPDDYVNVLRDIVELFTNTREDSRDVELAQVFR
jgi:hypothetical protein